MRSYDWARSALGPPESWPQSLKTAVRIMLTSRQPIWIGWGRELIYLYNDPYKSIIGGKHPWALGRPTSEVWREIWSDIGPMLATAMSGHEGTYVEAQLLIMERNGYPEETYYTFSYSPIPTDDGTAGGIFCANTDDTQRVIGERQLTLLRELATATSEARTWQQACERAAQALATNTRDLPFAMIYMAEPGSRTASLVSTMGIARDHPAAAADPVPGLGRPLADRRGVAEPCAARRRRSCREVQRRDAQGRLGRADEQRGRPADCRKRRDGAVGFRHRRPQPLPSVRQRLCRLPQPRRRPGHLGHRQRRGL